MENKITFDDSWEFTCVSDIPKNATMKLNQWKSTGYEIVFIAVRWEGEELNYLIARRKKQ